MKKIIVLSVVSLLFLSPLFSFAAVRVSSYTKSNGTYVAPHYRSNPDGNPYNNYSFPGNVNPYTGKVAPGNSDTYLNNYYKSNYTTYTPSYYSASVQELDKKTVVPTIVLPIATVSYVTKRWADANPEIVCSQSTFLRSKEKAQCETYRKYKGSYTWSITMNELDNRYYYVRSGSDTVSSCPDGYRLSFQTDPAKCMKEESIPAVPSNLCPAGYTCTHSN